MIKQQSITNNNTNYDKIKQTNSNTNLQKLFRLYSPTHTIRTPNITSTKSKTQSEKSVIELIFPHPNLLFIHPQKIKDPAEKHAFMELNMIKNIVQRKQKYHLKQQEYHYQKPMTAPNMCLNKSRNMSNMQTSQKKDKQDTVNICILSCDKQNAANFDPFDSTSSWRKTKTLTSKTKFRKTNSSFKQNEQFNNEKSFRNKLINRNTFDFILQQKKKTIKNKYQQDKRTRQNMYKKSLKSPKTMMYINMEGKFLKYFK